MGPSKFNPGREERCTAWSAGRLIGVKRVLKPQQVWAIRFWLEHQQRLRDKALSDLAIDIKLRSCDVVKVRIAWGFAGWSAVCAFGAALVAIVLGLHARGRIFQKSE